MKRVSGDQVGTLASMSIGEVGRHSAPDTQALSQHRSQPTWSFTRAGEQLCQAGQERAISDATDIEVTGPTQPWAWPNLGVSVPLRDLRGCSEGGKRTMILETIAKLLPLIFF